MCFLAAHEALDWGISNTPPPHTPLVPVRVGVLVGNPVVSIPTQSTTHHTTPPPPTTSHHKTPQKTPPKTHHKTPPKTPHLGDTTKTRVFGVCHNVCVTKSPKNLFLSRRKPRKTPKNTCFGGPKTHPKNPPKPQCGDRFIARVQVGWFLTPQHRGSPRETPKTPQKPQNTPILGGSPKHPKNPLF